jgi:hypothetical protein
MAGLLSSSDITEILSAIKETTDTFFQYDVRLIKRIPITPRFSESKKNNYSTTHHDLKALVTYESGSRDAQLVKMVVGAADLAEGTLIFNFEDLNAANLIDINNNVLINAATDTFMVQGLEVGILGVILAGPMENYYALVKVPFKRKLKG